jgi:hypothetical protein
MSFWKNLSAVGKKAGATEGERILEGSEQFYI